MRRSFKGPALSLAVAFLLRVSPLGLTTSDVVDKKESHPSDGVVAAKAPRHVVPLCKRMPIPVAERTRPLYLQTYRSAHPQQRRGPPA
jgi:hypothetical protein